MLVHAPNGYAKHVHDLLFGAPNGRNENCGGYCGCSVLVSNVESDRFCEQLAIRTMYFRAVANANSHVNIVLVSNRQRALEYKETIHCSTTLSCVYIGMTSFAQCRTSTARYSCATIILTVEEVDKCADVMKLLPNVLFVLDNADKMRFTDMERTMKGMQGGRNGDQHRILAFSCKSFQSSDMKIFLNCGAKEFQLPQLDAFAPRHIAYVSHEDAIEQKTPDDLNLMHNASFDEFFDGNNVADLCITEAYRKVLMECSSHGTDNFRQTCSDVTMFKILAKSAYHEFGMWFALSYIEFVFRQHESNSVMAMEIADLCRFLKKSCKLYKEASCSQYNIDEIMRFIEQKFAFAKSLESILILLDEPIYCSILKDYLTSNHFGKMMGIKIACRVAEGGDHFQGLVLSRQMNKSAPQVEKSMHICLNTRTIKLEHFMNEKQLADNFVWIIPKSDHDECQDTILAKLRRLFPANTITNSKNVHAVPKSTPSHKNQYVQLCLRLYQHTTKHHSSLFQYKPVQIGKFQSLLDLSTIGIDKTIVSSAQSSKPAARDDAMYKGCVEVYNIENTLILPDATLNVKSSEKEFLQQKPLAKLPSTAAEQDSDVPNSFVRVPIVTSNHLGMQDFPTQDVSSIIELHLYALSGFSNLGLLTTRPITPWKDVSISLSAIDPSESTSNVKLCAYELLRCSYHQVQSCVQYYQHLVRICLRGLDMDDVSLVPQSCAPVGDKGYAVVPILPKVSERFSKCEINYTQIHKVLSMPPLRNIPFAEDYNSEWIELLKNAVVLPIGRYTTAFHVDYLTNTTLTVAFQERGECESTERYWKKYKVEKKTKTLAFSTALNPLILGRWYRNATLKEANQEQKLLKATQYPAALAYFREPNKSKQLELQKERLLVPELTHLLSYPASVYASFISLIPALFDLELVLQARKLKNIISAGLVAESLFPDANNVTSHPANISLELIRTAIEKPKYERLEMLGDSFLKFESSWSVYVRAARNLDHNKISAEDLMNRRRSYIVSNKRLQKEAIQQNLHHFIKTPSVVASGKWDYWAPSLSGAKLKQLSIPRKNVADAVEALGAAYLVHGGERLARAFLKWCHLPLLGNDRLVSNTNFFAICIEAIEKLVDSYEIYESIIQSKSCYAWHTNDKLEKFESLLKYRFSDQTLLRKALTHKTCIDLSSMGSDDTYEALEFWGDGIIDYLSVSYAFRKYPTWSPGELTRWKVATLSNLVLGQVAILCFCVDEVLRHDLPDFFEQRNYLVDEYYSKGTEDFIHNAKHQVNGSCKVFADAFESLVAAVFLDCNYDLAVVHRVFMVPLLHLMEKEAIIFSERGPRIM